MHMCGDPLLKCISKIQILLRRREQRSQWTINHHEFERSSAFAEHAHVFCACSATAHFRSDERWLVCHCDPACAYKNTRIFSEQDDGLVSHVPGRPDERMQRSSSNLTSNCEVPVQQSLTTMSYQAAQINVLMQPVQIKRHASFRRRTTVLFRMCLCAQTSTCSVLHRN